MTKFITEKENQSAHFEYCIAHKIPYIEINHLGKDYAEIFYDVTDLNLNLEEVSQEVKEIFLAYYRFFLLDIDIQRYAEAYYFFSFPVLNRHSHEIAEQLFDFLNDKMKN